MRILPEICAMISCPFSNSTRNIALDNASLMMPSCSIEACLAIYLFYFMLPTACTNRSAKINKNIENQLLFVQNFFDMLKAKQYIRLALLDRNHLFKMCRQFAIYRTYRPSIIPKLNTSSSGIDHRFYTDDHTFFQLRARTA